MSQPEKQSRWRAVAWVAAAPVIFALAFFARSYPLAANWQRHLFGQAGVDQSTQLWLYWWTKYALWDSPQSLLYTHHLNYPLGVDITGDFICFLHALLAVPLQGLFGLTGAVNALYLLTYVFTSFGVFMLVRHLTRSNLLAVVAGLLMVHLPYYTALNSLNTDLLSFGFAALFILYLLRTTQEEGWRPPVLAGLMLALTSMENMEHGLFMYLFLAFHLVYTGVSLRRQRQRLKLLARRVAALVVVFAVLVAPFAVIISLQMHEHHPHRPGLLGKGDLAVARDCEPGQMDPTKYQTRSQGKVSADKLAALALGLGLLVVAMLLLGAGADLRYWLTAALLFLLFSTGEAVSILWGAENPMAEPLVKVPNYLYLLMHKLPFVWRFGWPDRMVMVTILCLLVLGALGAARVRALARQRGWARAAAVGALLAVSTLGTASLVHWELWQLPRPDALQLWMPLRLAATPYHAEQMYLDLGAEEGEFGMMILPALDWTGPVAMGNMRYAQQPFSQKPLADCHIPPFKVRYQLNCAYLDFKKYVHLGLMDHHPNEQANQRPLPARPDQIIKDLAKAKIRYVVVNLMIPAPYDQQRLLAMMDSWVGRYRSYPRKYVVYRMY